MNSLRIAENCSLKTTEKEDTQQTLFSLKIIL